MNKLDQVVCPGISRGQSSFQEKEKVLQQYHRGDFIIQNDYFMHGILLWIKRMVSKS